MAETLALLLQEERGKYAEKLVRVFGSLIYESNELCHRFISSEDKASELQVLISLQKILAEGSITYDSERVCQAALWLLSNIASNSPDELNSVMQSGIMAIVTTSFMHTTCKATKEEFINVICDIVVNHVKYGQLEKLSDFFKTYSIELLLIDNLRNSQTSNKSEQLTLLTF